MFTGLITTKGKIIALESLPEQGQRITIQTQNGWNNSYNVAIGDSIAVQGACMTVVHFTENTFTIEVSPESINKLKPYQLNDEVNLESSLRIGDKLGGHFVTGHIDGIGNIITFHQEGNFWHLTLSLSETLFPYIVSKGSITVNGVSLTINQVHEHNQTIELMIIPHTQQETVLLNVEESLPQVVNIEVDMLAKFAMKKG